jgi:alpha-galactosidase
MGWNSWNAYKCNINENIIRQNAKAMVDLGMKDAGYEYVVVDDCWQKSRDADGNIQADPERFPSGIKALSDYVHSLGLKFGIYTDAGTKTCTGEGQAAAGMSFRMHASMLRWRGFSEGRLVQY